MSVRFDAAADRLLRTTDLPDYNAPYTWMAWVYLVSDLNATSIFYSLNRNDSASDMDEVRTTASGTILQIRAAIGGSVGTNVNGTDLSLGVWYHLAMVRESATSLKLYLNGTLDITNTRDVTGRTAASRMENGARGTSNISRSDSRVAYIKAWSTNLTQAEVQAEMNVIPAVKTDNLYGEWKTPPGSGRITDSSGNGRDWTEGGTLTDEEQPAVPLAVSVSETITLTEEVSGVTGVTISAGETITLAEGVTALLPTGIDAGETITLTDTLAIAIFSIITIRGSVREPG